MREWFLPCGNAKKTAFLNARIIDPQTGLDIIGDLVSQDGLIQDFGTELLLHTDLDCFDHVIDCKKNILMPGVVDIHVHLRDPGQTHKEDIQSGTKSAVAGGVTTVVCQPNTKPPIDNIETIEYIKQKAINSAYANVLVYASITKNGQALTDMAALKKAGAVGFTDDGLPVMNPLLMQKAFMLAAELQLPIAQHAEDLFLSNKGCINHGNVSFELNVPGILDISESIMVARDIMLLDKIQAHYHVLHISTRKSVEAVQLAKERGLNVTCEVTPHHLLLNEQAVLGYNTSAKMNPPLRTEEDRLYMIQSLKDGTIDAIASDHAPHDEESKNTSIAKAAFGIVGLETILPLSLELYHNGAMHLHDLLAKLTCNPAKILGLNCGQIKIDAPADLIVLDLDKEWIIKPQNFASKSKNSPFDNKKTKGAVLHTFVRGHNVFCDTEN